MYHSNRRDFLKTTAAGLTLGGFGASVLAEQKDGPAEVPTRPLGDTGERVSIIGLGGWHIGSIPEKEAIPIMHEAIDSGVTFFDNAWDYHTGGSEEVMGKALATGGRRDKVFLMTKVCDRDYKGCLQHLEDSLRRLKTDRIDLWQFHEINYKVDPDWIFERGCLKAALEAKKAGKIRYIGFTGHKDMDIHLAMLAKPFDWDAAQMPLNVLDPHYRSFAEKVMPVCNKRNIGVIGMKALAAGGFPRLGLDPAVCRRYVLSLPISTLVCGMTSRENLKQDLGVARNFKPMSAKEIGELLAKTKPLGVDGRNEGFKTSRAFDAGYHRRQHGV